MLPRATGERHNFSRIPQKQASKRSKTLLLLHNVGHLQPNGIIWDCWWLRTGPEEKGGEEGPVMENMPENPNNSGSSTITGNFRRKEVEERACEGEEEAPRRKGEEVNQE